MKQCILFAAGMALAARPGLAERIEPAALAALPPADVVILGEVHDNPRHHENQAVAVAALRPAALVFEMLTAEKAGLIRPSILESGRKLAAELEWDRSGWPDFSMYHPILLAAPEAKVFGAEVVREAAREAVTDGAAAAFGPAAVRFGLDRPLDPSDLASRVEEQRIAHCGALPEDLLPGMVEAQRLRDASLARAVLEAMEDTGGPVAVITGTGHARRDVGLPSVLAAVAPQLRVLSVGQFEEPPEGEVPFDLWLVTAPAEREDPCATLTGD
ncbi:ChaN family lipoprotein [Rhodobacter sp. CZR27]|uniref:ChaN family lipoprotein n=1 Tax=Rhodobacter sp. CZR27 TaxID=2033869 RepID=UPI000BBF152B|nr:ChaN family lipoprotein [Rhodobacter sp. CZR27]